ncbi:TPA: Crp/Fnr family transcriptional regulator [Elizabethkingia anophelis]|uniref:Crp/Fnr family transcriptional regulator n=1 Tax=Elizabethkingia anophelis TaxID=1117645 RepID=UPI000994EB69|nr:Crp/Fnr family transcriptional regulator [Elizabethkingia anophelis]AQW94875.1 hypothetical protein BBD30_12180 [Elizabethkingia anophelis]MCL1690572.1 Crp/Fnr family transcriptional regulator [Elizabethkingia anophelis]MDV3950842.1 Crp/Fnr family transcriptional regulator [Elizabethkingia anophelis]MDV4010138.1 Crp/Fnr family transcriptional regulator [Elizabethkingia anophelis]MYY49901.1 Crp/Fnr family transcriptional regulator [Elizabethkingia anophelis]
MELNKNDEDLYKELIFFFNKYMSIDTDDINDIKKYFKHKFCGKNIILEEKGSVTNNLYFVISGFVHVYTEIERMDETIKITTLINCPASLITIFGSFNNEVPSGEYLKTITKVSLLIISREDFIKLFFKNDKWKEVFRQLFALGQIYNEKRFKDIIKLNAEERYLNLIKTQPDLINNIPTKILASYIGIRPQSLSRLKKNSSLILGNIDKKNGQT